MADTFTSFLRLIKQTIGANKTTWGTNQNSCHDMIDEAIAGQVSVSVTAGNVTLTTANNATDQSRPALLIITGTPGTGRTVTFPNVKKLTWVYNNCDSTVTCTAGAGTTVSIISGAKALIYMDGSTNVAKLADGSTSGTFTPVFTTSATPPTGVTYATQSASYVLLGSVVFVLIQVSLTSKGTGATGSIRIGGLPFVPASLGANMVVKANNVDLTSGRSWITGLTVSASAISIQENGDNVVGGSIPWSQATDTSEFFISGFYLR